MIQQQIYLGLFHIRDLAYSDNRTSHKNRFSDYKFTSKMNNKDMNISFFSQRLEDKMYEIVKLVILYSRRLRSLARAKLIGIKSTLRKLI